MGNADYLFLVTINRLSFPRSVLRPAFSSCIGAIVDSRFLLVVVLPSARAFYAVPSLRVSGQSSTPAFFWLLSSQVHERLRRALSSCIGAIVDSRFLLVVVLPSARAFTSCLLFVYRGNRRLPLSSGRCPPKCTSVYAVPSLRVSGQSSTPDCMSVFRLSLSYIFALIVAITTV